MTNNTDPQNPEAGRAPSQSEQSLLTHADTLTPAQAGARAAWLDEQTPRVPVDQIILGDCQRVLRTLPDASIDFVLTDPPYLVNFKDRAGRKIDNDDNSNWLYPAFSELFRVMKPDTYAVSFYGWGKAERFLSIWKACGFRPVGHFVWVKRYASSARHTRMMHEQAYLLAKGNPTTPTQPPSDVIEWAYTGNRLHPTQKPVSGLVLLVKAFCKPNGVTLDPFGGSGSTGIAAMATGRHYLLIEQDEAYHRAASERLTAYRNR
jgi:site-specific DNA-methyltransferase (adenine-specific)